jgi:hypothetical protein
METTSTSRRRSSVSSALAIFEESSKRSGGSQSKSFIANHAGSSGRQFGRRASIASPLVTGNLDAIISNSDDVFSESKTPPTTDDVKVSAPRRIAVRRNSIVTQQESVSSGPKPLVSNVSGRRTLARPESIAAPSITSKNDAAQQVTKSPTNTTNCQAVGESKDTCSGSSVDMSALTEEPLAETDIAIDRVSGKSIFAGPKCFMML